MCLAQKEKPKFILHVDGAESWSWADIKPNHEVINPGPIANVWNEIARDVLE